MNESRYSASGTTQSSGTTATSWQTWFVVARSISEAQAGNSSQQRPGRRQVGAAGWLPFARHDRCRAWPRRAARRCHAASTSATCQTRRPQSTAYTAKPPDQSRDWTGSVEGRLEQERIAQQRRQRAEVGNGIQPIGRSARIAAAEPDLHQRAGGREHEVRQADGDRQAAQDPPGGQRSVRRLPACRRARSAAATKRGRDQRQVDDGLPARRHPALPAGGRRQ